MNELGFESCKADPDVWLRLSRKVDGSKYYQYVLLYTDDILAVMEEPERFLRDEFGKCFALKEKIDRLSYPIFWKQSENDNA